MKTDKNSRTTTTEGTQPKPELTVPDKNHSNERLKTLASISFERWLVKYRPVKNPLDSNASFNGCMFETHGEELRLVCAQYPPTIWTLVECDGNPRILDGLHYVNRLGYFITEVQAPENHYFSIKAD